MDLDKKIEEAAKKNSTEIFVHPSCSDIRYNAFKDGAHWAINEFLKSLWHPTSEEPKTDECFILVLDSERNAIQVFNLDCYMNSEEYDDYNYSETWKIIVENEGITSWCYLEDLLTKEGGNDEKS